MMIDTPVTLPNGCKVHEVCAANWKEKHEQLEMESESAQVSQPIKFREFL